MSRRMLRTDIYHEFLRRKYRIRPFFELSIFRFDNGVCDIIDRLMLQSDRIQFRVCIIIFSERIPHPVVSQKQPAHIGVVDETDSKKIIDFTFV